MSGVAVVTVAAGRHEHLRRQHRSLAAAQPAPERTVVVSMGDPEVADVVRAGPLARGAAVLELEVEADGRLPLAQARNTGVEAAIAGGAELVVLLDVDCLPSPPLLDRYLEAARGPAGGDLLCGPVAYLPPPSPSGYDEATLAAAAPHPGRPAPADGEVARGGDHRLFWSLSFAVTPAVWRLVGGFDEAYVGYGAEDTDLGQRAARAGVGLAWVGGATAYHQWHPVSNPPTEHLADIVRNANVFRRRWGWTPMEGWLAGFERAGSATRDAEGWWRVC